MQPLELAEGEEVNIRILEAEVTRQQKIAVLRAKIAQRLANPPDPDEGEAVSWEEFHAFLQDNRFDVPERDLGLNDE
ncbi:MAG: hypothetical protein JW910_05790 [Anaerolineae bacterium]|nr:hypothetical protein [Anaerolineae bacterium]